MSRLISTYFLSHNTIHSTSRTLFILPAEQPLVLSSSQCQWHTCPCQGDVTNSKASPQQVAAPTLEILQEVWVAPKAVLCVQEHWAKGWKRKAPHPWLLVLPWGLGSEWLGVEFQLACTGGLPLKRREPQPSFSLLPPATNNPEKLLAIYQDFHHFFLLGHSHDVQKKN